MTEPPEPAALLDASAVATRSGGTLAFLMDSLWVSLPLRLCLWSLFDFTVCTRSTSQPAHDALGGPMAVQRQLALGATGSWPSPTQQRREGGAAGTDARRSGRQTAMSPEGTLFPLMNQTV